MLTPARGRARARCSTGGYTAFVVPAGAVPTGGLDARRPRADPALRARRRALRRLRPRRACSSRRRPGSRWRPEQPPPPDYQVPGASFRMLVDTTRAAARLGASSEESFVFNVGDPIISPDGATTATVVASYPDDERFFSSGYTEGADALRGTPAVISEEVGEGQVVVFAFDANFRAYTESTIRMFANAILHPVAGDSAVGGFAAAAGAARAGRPHGRDAVIRVPARGEAALRAAVAAAAVPSGARITRDLRGVSLRVPGGRALDRGQAAWPQRVLEGLRRAGRSPEPDRALAPSGNEAHARGHSRSRAAAVRIVAGRHKGRRLRAPAGAGTRPTADRVREALFSILGPVDGTAGARPLRRLRGARHRGALARRGLGDVRRVGAPGARGDPREPRRDRGRRRRGRCTRTRSPGCAAAAGERAFDLVFCDPPYDAAARVAEPLGDLLPRVAAPRSPHRDRIRKAQPTRARTCRSSTSGPTATRGSRSTVAARNGGTAVCPGPTTR